MASVHKQYRKNPQGKKSWTGRWLVSYRDPDYKQRSRVFLTAADAKAFMSDNDVKLRKGEWIDPSRGRRTFGDFADEWIDHINVRDNTLAAYRATLNNHVLPTFRKVSLKNITTESVRRWLVKLRKAGNLNETSIAKAYRLLKQVLSIAVSDGYITKNPCTIKGAGQEPKYDAKVPSAEQVLAIADAVPLRYRALVLLAGFGGLRWGEVVALRRRSVNVGAASVSVVEQVVETSGRIQLGEPKSDAGVRTVYLPAFVVDALVLHLTQWCGSGVDALLFTAPRTVGEKATNQTERYLRRGNFRKRIWIDATDSAGCAGVRFHDLRHTAATLAATTGATIKELMAHIGHASPVAAMRYQHATEDRRKKIATGINDLVPTPAKAVPLRGA